jgi:hypothetical protein
MSGEIPDVNVKFTGDAGDAVKAGAETEAAIKGVGKASDDTAAKIKKNSKDEQSATTDFTRLLQTSNKDAVVSFGSVSKAIDDQKAKVKDLQRQFHTGGGSDSVFGDLSKAKSDLKDLTSIAEDMAPGFAKAGEEDGNQFVEQFGAAFSAVGEYIVPELLAVAAGVAPLLVSMLGSAIATGIGAAGLGVGIYEAIQNPQVKTALGMLEKDFGETGAVIGQEFAGPVEHGILDIKAAWDKVSPGIEHTFADLALAVKPIADGLSGALKNFAPGLDKSLNQAVPLLNELGSLLPGIGTALGQMFDDIDKNGPGSALALEELVGTVEVLVEWFGDAVSASEAMNMEVTKGIEAVASAAGHLLSDLSSFPGMSWVKPAADQLNSLAANEEKAITSAQGFASADLQAAASVAKLNTGVQLLTTSYEAWLSAADQNDNALLSMKQSELALTDSLKKNKDQWSLNTTAGLANYAALLQVDQAQQKYYGQLDGSKKVTETATQQELDAAKALLKQADAAGASSTETATLRGEISKLEAQLKLLKGKKVTVNVHFVESGSNVPAKIAAELNGYANSGIASYANSGVAGAIPHFDATGIYDAGMAPLYRFAEQSTVQEAVIARNGDAGRAISAVREAASWHDMDVVPSGSAAMNTGAAGNGAGGPLTVVLQIDSKTVATALIPSVSRQNARGGVLIYGGGVVSR